MGFFTKISTFVQGLSKTRSSFLTAMGSIFSKGRNVNEELFEDLEETLLMSDVGAKTTMKFVEELKEEAKKLKIKEAEELQNLFFEKISKNFESTDDGSPLTVNKNGLTVFLFVGVNGVGKTSTIAKLASRFKNDNKKVMVAAGDTFRAGSVAQLEVWANRIGVDIVKHAQDSDPAAVIYDAVQAAKARKIDILLCDTAGRLHNKINLMEELKKINRIIKREIPDAPHEVLLVLDATTGQNALLQCKQFSDAVDVTGLVLTKLDGSAKGGIVIAIKNEFNIPVKLLGLGEKAEDLADFDSGKFIQGLLGSENRDTY